jgi:hypothetical protein
MPNKKISEFPTTTTLAGNDIFLINHLDTTSTISFSTVLNTTTEIISTNIINILSGDTAVQKLSTIFIKKPETSSIGQVLTYDGITNTWVASSVSF